MSAKLKIISLLLVLSLTSCVVVNKINTPLFTAGKQTVITANYHYPFAFDFELAHSFKDSMAIISGLNVYAQGYSTELGLGKFVYKKTYRDFYLGIGGGKDNDLHINFAKIFLQASYGYNSKNFAIIGSGQITARYINQFNPDQNEHYVFWAPYWQAAITLKLGFDKIALLGQIGLTLPLEKEPNIPQQAIYPVAFPILATLGVGIKF